MKNWILIVGFLGVFLSVLVMMRKERKFKDLEDDEIRFELYAQ
ncbi:MAG: hypothetical protein RMJ81_02240 [Candidatus Kryptonium sp.]|nr:hypothetical protein [Candidatus Kryptonium sp.]MCX7761635.1 hypothetical protein [Candidatus Kryptonium sp.]MDW8108457.1 hypothetical protein [Candidatus Kryptonium sp.]